MTTASGIPPGGLPNMFSSTVIPTTLSVLILLSGGKILFCMVLVEHVQAIHLILNEFEFIEISLFCLFLTNSYILLIINFIVD
jgi:hypothetical protein